MLCFQEIQKNDMSKYIEKARDNYLSAMNEVSIHTFCNEHVHSCYIIITYYAFAQMLYIFLLANKLSCKKFTEYKKKFVFIDANFTFYGFS